MPGSNCVYSSLCDRDILACKPMYLKAFTDQQHRDAHIHPVFIQHASCIVLWAVGYAKVAPDYSTYPTIPIPAPILSQVPSM